MIPEQDVTREQAVGHPLATKGGLEFMVALLMGSGSICSRCGFGTRATSKNWARCKKCGHRNRRRSMDDVADVLAGKKKLDEVGDTA